MRDLVAQGAPQRLTMINYAFAVPSPVDPEGRTGRPGDPVRVVFEDPWTDYGVRLPREKTVDGADDPASGRLFGNFRQIMLLKQQFPHLRILLSLGGWTGSAWFSDAAATSHGREALAESACAIVRGDLPSVRGPHGLAAGGPGAAVGLFDGIDLDWEFPGVPGHPHNVYRPEDRETFPLLLAAIRTRLNEMGQETGLSFWLTASVPAGPNEARGIEVSAVLESVDWLNLMAYDFHGSWEPEGPTAFHANLFEDPERPGAGSADAAVRYYLSQGCPADRLVLGVPFYGHGWEAPLDSPRAGLYEIARRSLDDEIGGGAWHRLARLGYRSHRDPRTGGHWFYDRLTGRFWAVDDPETVRQKMHYVRAQGLRGIMIWSLDADDEAGSLLHAVHDGLSMGASLPLVTPAGLGGSPYRRPTAADWPGFRALQARGFGEAGGSVSVVSEEDEDWDPSTSARGLFVDGECVSGCYLPAFETLWADRVIALWGVGGVCALPEARRRGFTARLLRGAIREMYENGVPLSAVTTPFSYAFYRALGYEYAFPRWRITAAPRVLAYAGRASEGGARFITVAPDGAVPAALETVYRRVVGDRYQGASQRSPGAWRQRLQGKTTYVYLWEDSEGPAGYLIAALHDPHAASDSVVIRECLAAHRGALQGLLAVAANLDSQGERVVWGAPPDYRFDLAWGRPDELSLEAEPSGMLRLVDAERALASRSYGASAEGTLGLFLEDDDAPWNRRALRLQFSGARVAVDHQVQGIPEARRVRLDQRTLAQIYSGAVTPVEALALRPVDAGADAAALLTAAFVTGRSPLFMEWF